LEALEKFFSNMPADTDIAFVIIQHLSPKYKSIMGSLLAKHTAMPIVKMKDGMKIKPNNVYLNPPDKNVVIFKGAIQLMEPVKTGGINLPIDCFFRSLAEDRCDKAICIILSGTATDGTLGLKAVKGAGGLAIVQAPDSAKYDGMPRSAIDTGLVDLILPIEQIPRELLKYLHHFYIEGPEGIHMIEGQFKDYIRKIFFQVRRATGHDFSNYKMNTIRRRIERRMAVLQVDKLPDYVRHIQENPEEIETLFKDLLIGVTSFFRDPEAFEFLERQVVPDILTNKPPDAAVRVWVVGCSTGEEAYSAAMLFSEALEKLQKPLNIQIFASDIDSEAIEHARLGTYPDSIAADVSPERLNRFFIKKDNTFRIKKQIREMVIFALQSLVEDPPFSKIDLVCCRNLLIYMNAALQKKVLPLFHYTLNPDGYLFLGTSESIGEATDIFEPINSKWKIFRNKKKVAVLDMDYGEKHFYDARPSARKEIEKKLTGENDILAAAEKIIIENYSPAGVLINDKYQIIQFIGETSACLSIPSGKASFDLLKMARDGLRYKLSTALLNASRQKKTIVCKGVWIQKDEQDKIFDVLVHPITDKSLPQGYMLVLFDDKIPVETPGKRKEKPPRGEEKNPEVINLESELQSTREYLQTTIEELETSNEELKSTNEELQSVNEELQSTNEELETSKEELQSTNEELVTVNTELQKKVDELSQANNDINNLLASTEIGTIFLDADLRIKRFTPAITAIFNLIQSDTGRPISDITSNIIYENLPESARKVLETLDKKEMEVRSKKGGWYTMKIAPYRTVDNIIDGIVITFVDISRIRRAEGALRESEDKLKLSFEQKEEVDERKR
jgi:two-component system CheB/CheR fusion protein